VNSLTWDNFWWAWDKFGVITVTAVILAYWLDQRSDRIEQQTEAHDQMIRACDAMLTEISQNKLVFTDTTGYVPRVIRAPDIDYFAARFGSQAFQSLLHSGFYSSFRTETQLMVSRLYDRIDLSNEMVTYLAHYFDEFTLYGNSPQRVDIYINRVRWNELSLTRLSNEIRGFLDASEEN